MKFDGGFLDEVGLSNLPEAEKEDFLARAQDLLEVRVGERISADLSEQQLVEFEGIMDNDQEVVRRLVFKMKQDFREDPIYIKLLERHGVQEGNWDILDEYLSIKWIQDNRPDYRDIVAEEAEKLKAEIRERGAQAVTEAPLF